MSCLRISFVLFTITLLWLKIVAVIDSMPNIR